VIGNNNTLQGKNKPFMLQTNTPDIPKTDDLFQIDEQETAIDLKGSVFTLPVLCMKSIDLNEIERDLKERLAKSPQFFQNAPIVIDLEAIKDCADDFDFPKFVTLLRGLHLVPVGVQHGTKSQHESAKWAGFAELRGGAIQELPTAATRRRNTTKNKKTSANNEQPNDNKQEATTKNNASTRAIISIESTPTTKVIRQPVRSGQRIYHQGGDLILLAAVNAGAEVMADGNIHVYAPLRGRALAGVKGKADARIFCQHMEAELVAVAGQYRVFENKVPPEMLGRPVQIFMEGDKIVIASLD
jgi:septum site-determining protein MinC